MELNVRISVTLCPLDMAVAGLSLAVTCGRPGHGTNVIRTLEGVSGTGFWAVKPDNISATTLGIY